MDKNLLVICPSRGRPERLKTMLDSFDKTKSEGTEMVIYVADDDPCLKQYQFFFKDRNIQYGERLYLAEVLNKFSTGGYKYYGEVNDDHVYRTEGWDKILTGHIESKNNGWGIACGWDMMQATPEGWSEHKKPSACIVSGNIIETLGYFVHPAIQHLFIDDVLRDLALGIDALHFDPRVIIEHRHFLNQKASQDAGYQWAYNPTQWDYGWNAYNYWKNNIAQRDINKINEVKNAT